MLRPHLVAALFLAGTPVAAEPLSNTLYLTGMPLPQLIETIPGPDQSSLLPVGTSLRAALEPGTLQPKGISLAESPGLIDVVLQDDRNLVSVRQSGAAHSVTGYVEGIGNVAQVSQTGVGHVVMFSQIGLGNTLSIRQSL